MASSPSDDDAPESPEALGVAATEPIDSGESASKPGGASPTSGESSRKQLPAGSRVREYEIIELLGRGTFGTVYHATHAVIGKHVAIKLLNEEFSRDLPVVQRFVDEARAVNRIAHPNIVDIFDFGELADGRKYCVMEFLEGQTLADFAAKYLHCPWADAVRVLKQVAEALDAAHDAGVVHRDLKPENIFINGPVGASDLEGTVIKLLDFGIAKVADGDQRKTASGMVLGTPAYMSPEQCRGAQVDSKTDVYALGVVAYELLAGRRPFVGENAMQLIARHLTATPEPCSSLNPSLPPAVDSVLSSMLAKDPGTRPSRATEAIAELTSALGLTGDAKLLSTASRRSKVTSRSTVLTLFAVGAMALSLAGVAASWASDRDSPAAPVGVASSAEGPLAPPTLALPPSPPAAPAAASETVTLHVRGEPPTAKIMQGDEELGSLGEPFQLTRSEQELVLQVKAAGYAPQELRVVPNADRELDVTLHRTVRPKSDTGAKSSPGTKSDQGGELLY